MSHYTHYMVIKPMTDYLVLTTKLLSTGFDVNVIPSLILSFRSDTLVRDIFP